LNGNMVCLIGPGDSTKSTILLALEYLFSSSWNLSVSDADFHKMNIETPIEIIAVITELPEYLVSEDRFGMYLSFWNPQDSKLYEVQEHESYQKALQIKLEICRDLEPRWTVVALQSDGKKTQSITAADRRALGVTRIGNYVEADLAWGRNSALSRITQKEDISQIPAMLADAERNILKALKNMDFSVLSQAIQEVNSTSQTLGAGSQSSLQPGMDPMRVSLRQGAIALLDGNLPFSLRGAGSCRLMAMAIHKIATQEGAIILIDEIENSLEPYRLRHLIRQLRPQANEKHQVIFTTHSSVAVVECEADELYVVHSRDGTTAIVPVTKDLQAVVRSVPEAFLSRKVIVCEGKTESGLLISLDKEYWHKKHCGSTQYRHQTMAEAGVAPIESPKSGGSEAPKYAIALAKLGYRIAYFGDSDCKLNPSKDEMEAAGVEAVLLWDGGVEIERRLCFDLPWDGLKQFVALAIELIGSEAAIWDQIYTKLRGTGQHFMCCTDLDLLTQEIEESVLRENIGKAADDGKWFKRLDRGKDLGILLARYLDQMQSSPTMRTLRLLENWCYD